MTVSIVVAMSQNRVIGREGGLPWRLSTDLKRFKALTMGHPVVMGRKTFESFPGHAPLPGRLNIVVTHNRGYRADGAVLAGSLDEALAIAAAAPGGDEIYVIGGGEIFAESMDVAEKLHVTHVLSVMDGDTCFPVIDPLSWNRVHEEMVPVGEKDDFATRYVVYERARRPVGDFES